MAAKVKQYKGFKIHNEAEGVFKVYTADEWSMGKGFRYEEWEAGTEQEAREFIDCYDSEDKPARKSKKAAQPAAPAQEVVEAPAAPAKKQAKLSPTMEKVMHKLRTADWYYMRDGKTCGYFATEDKVRSVGFEGAGIVEGGFVYSRMDSKTLEALRVRGLVEVLKDGGECLDVVKVVGMEFPKRLTKAIHFRARRYFNGRLVQDHTDCYATSEKAIEFAREYFHGGRDEVTIEIDVYGEAELTVWDFFKNK